LKSNFHNEYIWQNLNKLTSEEFDETSHLPQAIKETQKDIKLLNYELKRVIATDQESFVTLSSFYET
jgi:hypothetical protein